MLTSIVYSEEMHWDTLWINVHLATMANQGTNYIRDAAIASHNGRIQWVGARADLPNNPHAIATQVYDGEGHWLTPGFIDCHTHLVYAGSRKHEYAQILQGASYLDIAKHGGGIQSTVRATREVSEEELFAQSLPRVQAMMQRGVRCIEIKSGYGLDYSTEAKSLRVARQLAQKTSAKIVATYLGAHTVPPEFSDADHYIDAIISEYLPALHQEGLVDAVDIYCEKQAFSAAQAARLFLAARKLNLPVKCHAEQFSDCGASKISAQFSALSVDHLEYCTKESINALAQSGTVAVLLPGAYYYLREKKLPPVDLFRAQHIPMAIATDCNPGSSPFTSLNLMMNMACVFFGLTPSEALLGVTKHAAAALGLRHDYGQLAPGFIADYVLWDIHHPEELCANVADDLPLGIIIAGQLQT